MATDINTKTLVLTDLQPPPLCRFMKVATLAYYMSVVGMFFMQFLFLIPLTRSQPLDGMECRRLGVKYQLDRSLDTFWLMKPVTVNQVKFGIFFRS